jgi:hypothetical protein
MHANLYRSTVITKILNSLEYLFGVDVLRVAGFYIS